MMDKATARRIMARVLAAPGAPTRIGPAVAEWSRYVARGDTTMADAAAETVDDMVGHYDEDGWVGARRILEAMRVLGDEPFGAAPEHTMR